MQRLFLVEIRTKDYLPLQILDYIEVLASDEYYARHVGFAAYEQRIRYEPATRLKFSKSCLSLAEICAAEAIELD